MDLVCRVKPDRFVYLSGPLNAGDGYSVSKNIAAAVEVLFACVRAGIPAYCPHAAAGFYMTGVSEEQWMQIDFAVIDRCTHVLTLPRWQSSLGAQREVDYARKKGIPIVGCIEELL